MAMSGGLADINRAFNLVPKRAESRQTDRLRDTFVDSGVAGALEAIDHQVLYGRRGTGKTHAFRYLQNLVDQRGDIALYVDLRTIGSPEGLFSGDAVPVRERAARLMVDMLGQLHDALLAVALGDEGLIVDQQFVSKLDALLSSIATMRVSGEVEISQEGKQSVVTRSGGSLALKADSQPRIGLNLLAEDSHSGRDVFREVRRGTERISLNFSDVARALRELIGTLSRKRVWLLLDEWSSVPADTQGIIQNAFLKNSNVITVAIASGSSFSRPR